VTEDCKEIAFYGLTRPTHCETHRSIDEENLCLRKCKNEECSVIEICNDEGFCFEYCVKNELFQRSKKHKELRVKKLLETEIDKKIYIHDKIIEQACNRRRPDIVYDCDTHFLVIEVDENQHKKRECEEIRMQELTQSFGMPVIFIRYNPDNYRAEKMLQKNKREQILVEWVRHCIKLSPNDDTEFLRVIYLCYDGFDHTDVKIQNIEML